MTEHEIEQGIIIPGMIFEFTAEFSKELFNLIIQAYRNPDQPGAGAIKQEADKIIREKIPNKPNPGQLRRELEAIWLENSELKNAVIKAWELQNIRLVHICNDWMGKNFSLVSDDLVGLQLAVRSKRNCELLEDFQKKIKVASAQIMTENPNIGSPVAIQFALSLWIRSRIGDVKEVNEDSKISELTNNGSFVESPLSLENEWQELIDRIRQIPPDSLCWGSVDGFIKIAQLIAAEKRQESEKGLLFKRLSILLEDYKPKIMEQVAYLELDSSKIWTIESFSSYHVETAIVELERLAQLAETCQQLQALPSPKTRPERFNLENRLRQSEDEFTSAFQAFENNLHLPSQVSSEEKPSEEKPTEAGLLSETHPAEDSVKELELQASSTTEKVQAGQAEGGLSCTDLFQTQETKNEHDNLSPDTETPTEAEVLTQHEQMVVEITNLVVPESLEEPAQSNSEYDAVANNAQDQQLIVRAEIDYGSFTNLSSPLLSINENVVKGDLSAFYWYLWALEEKEIPTDIPSWLVASIQATLWHLALWPSSSQSFSDSIRDVVKPGERLIGSLSESQCWLALATGTYFSLTLPNCGWEEWAELPVPSSAVNVNAIVQLIRSEIARGVQLDPVLLELVVNTEQVEDEIKNLAAAAGNWLTQSKTRRARTGNATQVWQALIHSQDGDLYKLIEPVARDQRSQADEVLQKLKNWQDRSWVDRHIQKVDREIKQRKGFAVAGEERARLVDWSIEIVKVAAQWATTVTNSFSASQGRNWALDQLNAFCTSYNALYRPASIELTEILSNSPEPFQRVAVGLFARIITGIHALITPGGQKQLADWPEPPYQSRPHSLRAEATFLENLAYTLLFYPGIMLQNDGTPEQVSVEIISEMLSHAEPLNPEEAVHRWMTARDYRFINSLLCSLNNREEWEVRIRESVTADIRRLEHKEIEETVIAVEQALLESLIAEGEHTAYRSKIESVRKLIRQVDVNGVGNISIADFSQRLTQIQDELAAKRQERQANHGKHWHQLREHLLDITGDDQDLAAQIKEIVEKSLRGGDLRSTGEYLSHLADVHTGNKRLVHGLFAQHPEDKDQALEDFQENLHNLVYLLEPRSSFGLSRIRESILRDTQIQKFPIPSLPKPRRDEVDEGLRAWQYLKVNGQGNPQENLKHVETLMRYLGFSLADNKPVSLKSIPGGQSAFQHWRVSATAGQFAPVAQFGSQRRGYYDVIGVWDRPGIDAISAQVREIMQQTGNQPTIILYFHYLTPSRRETLFSTVRKDRLPMLFIDEALIVFLVREFGTRLKAMFLSSLPYSAINPYFPTGPVPPEVFKGRRDKVSSLIDPFGAVIVYGGRQLGKSALLRQVQGEFHHPEHGHWVIYEDIKLVGDPASGKNYQADMRDRLAQALVQYKILDSNRSNLEIDRLLAYIQQFVQEKNQRILLLLDEADHFLDADAQKNFYLVQKLKNLMDKTGRQFKVVLAGLHNVQRFQRISNQPLAHLGSPIEIGPLEPEAARDLLIHPLHALGYHFGQDPQVEDTSLILHILSYTNYHPGLIQLFGSHMVEHLLTKYQQSARPPLEITRADVEAVYRKKQVRNEICDRFNLTLALDSRYEAITLALILEQWDDQNGFDRLYTPKHLREIASNWWPEAFGNDVTLDSFKGFLEEMRGLGVLSVSQDGNFYRLRSPNLVYLMGTYDQICARMEDVAAGGPPGDQALESYHARLLDTEAFSPLTFAQERSLNHPRSGVALVFGLKVSGMRNLDHALERLVPEDTGVWSQIRVASFSAEAIQHQLNLLVKENTKANYLIAFRELDGYPDELLDQVLGAMRFCNLQSRNRTLRVCFAFDSQSAWQWFQLPVQNRESIEERVEVVVPIKRWDRLGIRQRLEMEALEDVGVVLTERLITRVLEVTGGWSLLLDELSAYLKGSKAGEGLDEFRTCLADPGNSIRKTFISSLGIFESLPRKVIRVLQQPEVIDMLQKESSYLDVLSLVVDDQLPEAIEIAVEFLERMSIVSTKPHLALDPVISRLWNES